MNIIKRTLIEVSYVHFLTQHSFLQPPEIVQTV